MTGPSHRNSQRGFTLIEVMIALIVLSFGLLAIAAMQDMALGRNVDANEMSVVTNLAADMVERIRFNRPNVTAYNGIDTSNAGTRPLNAQAMAQGDYDQWAARLGASRLGGVRGLVTVAALGPANLNQSQVTVQVTWTGGMRTGTGTLATVLRSRSISFGTIVTSE
jgi:type IV pilus assembly protein PilV